MTAETNVADARIFSWLRPLLSISPQRALPATLIIVAVLVSMAWLFFFPNYQTNDDVGIRLVLEGRIAPGAEPSGYAFFINLALGQIIAALYRLAPTLHWYDLAEQGTLWLSSSVALYCSIRRIRCWSDVAFVTLIASIFFTAFISIQFTIVAILSAGTGAAAVLFVRRTPMALFEMAALTFSGTALIVLGCLFRLEAGLLSLFSIGIVWALSKLQRTEERIVFRPSWLLLFPIAGFVLVAAAVLYHVLSLAGSPEWRDFFVFNFKRAWLTRMAASRFDRATLAQAYRAAGLSLADYRLLRNWMFIDSRVINMETLGAVLSHLPKLPSSSAAQIVSLLSAYSAHKFLRFALLGMVLYEANKRMIAFVSLATLIMTAIIIAISILLKPLPVRVFWPLACEYLFALWMFASSPGSTRPHWSVAPLVVLSFLSAAAILVRGDWLSIAHRANSTREALADITNLALTGNTTAVVFGAAFPYIAVERPFGPLIIQRRLNLLPFGTLTPSPVMAPIVQRLAIPDIATWLCSDRVVLIMRPSAVSAFSAYYPRHRHYQVKIERFFSGKTFAAYRCRRASPVVP